ncbi:MAG: AAA family ATPase [Deltaproteobacteria bacterium]|nr:AAA family ATPase [Deltaproteobacteria bacterium]
MISLFESRQEDNDSDDEQFAYINKENLRNEKILLDVPTVSAIFSLIEKYKNIKDSDIEQPKIVLYGKDKYLSKIVTHLIALEYDTNILIQRLTEEDDVPFFLRTRRNKRLVGCKITNKTYKLALLSHSILLIDCQSNSHLKSLITSLETKGTNFKFYGLPILIHLCSDEISDIKESEILSQNLKLFKIDGLDKPTASKYLCHLLGINNPLQCDIFEEGNIKLGDIELIAKIAKQKATLNSVPIDDKILKESKDIVYKANESDSKMNITEDEDDEFLDKSRIVAETIKNITISNVVLNQKEQEIVNDIILSIKNRERLYSEILDNKVSYGKGIKILFYGPPGTGKTMTAKAIAGETNIPIISVRLEQLFNKYVGETEKNIRKYFNAAQNQNSILFIDECDSIIMSRDNLNRSFEFSFATTFLKEVENYEGILILSTNYEILRDRALNRRIHFFVKFENPTYEKRILLLKKIIPEKYINNINLETIAQLPFNGGHLKNAWIKAGIEILKGNNITTEFFTSAIIKEIEKEESDVTKKAGF